MAEMRMAELSRDSGLSVPTIKYYLRVGLLQPGRRTSVNQAVYDVTHLERLRLIRALAKVAGLPLNKIRDVVEAIDSDGTVLDVMAVTQDALVGDSIQKSPNRTAAARLREVVEQLGWSCHEQSPAYQAATRAIADLDREGLDAVLDRLEEYARAADIVGRTDVAVVSSADGLDQVIRGVVLGSVLRRPLLDALVLLAQQHYASPRGGGSTGE